MRNTNLLKSSLVILLMIFAFTSLWGQSIWTNPITGTNPNTSNPYTAGDAKNANITVSGIGRGVGATGTAANNRYNANSWNTTGIDLTAYFSFTLTPNANFEIDLTSFVYTGQSSGTGPSSFALRSSVDGYTVNIGSPSATGATISLSGGVYQNITTPITFRFYAWNTTNSTGTFSINDFTFNGTVAANLSPCTTPTSGSIADQEVTEPNAATFTLTGASNYTSIQWQRNTGSPNSFVNIPGANATTYITGATDVSMDGYLYRTVLTNAPGGCTSATATTAEAFLFVSESTAPALSSNPSALSGFTYVLGSSSASEPQDFILSGTNWSGTGNVVISASADYEISFDETNSYDDQLTINNYDGTDTSVYVRLKSGLAIGGYTGNITTLLNGQPSAGVSLNGTVTTPSAPVATDATNVLSDRFTANWNAVEGTTSYELDVYKMEGGISNTSGDAYWDFASASPNSTPEGVTVSALSQGNNNGTTPLISSTSASSGYAGASGSNNAGAAARTGALNTGTSAYFQFTITPDAGATMILTGMSFGTRSTATGTQAYTLRSSLDNYTSDLAGGSISNNSTWALKSNSGLSVSGTQGQAITFRIYGHSGAGGAAEGTANWRIDDLRLNVSTSSSTLTYDYILENEDVGNVTSYEVTGLDPETTYHYVVRALIGDFTTTDSNEIEVTTDEFPTTITWLGGGGWSNETGPETTEDDIIIEGNLVTTSDLLAKNLTVSETGSLTISTGNTITLGGKITNNAGAENFVVESGANLIQNSTYSANDNEGGITVQRESQTLVRLDYAMWASPVMGQQLQAFSPTTLPGRIYTYEGAAGYVEVPDANLDFQNGKGYLFRAPNDWSTDPTIYSGEFIGVPFNGDVNVEVYPNDYTSVGNPYASNIDPELVMAGNDIEALYFWNNPERVYDEGTETWGYTGTRYITFTGAGFSDSDYDGNSITVGQGFIVESTSNSVNFNNDMRAADAGTFFKNEVERHRLWLNLSNEENQNYNKILVAYMEGATQGIDDKIDGKLFGYTGSALYNIINEEKFTIQGRSLPFETSDVVPLGFKAETAGKFNISLDNLDGLFTEGEVTVYLKDNELNITHNLMESAYTFESAAGEFKNRFEIVYETEEIMGVGDLNANAIQIYKDSDNIVVSSKTEKILSVELYDLQGRSIHRNEKVNSNIYQIKSASKGVLVVRVQTQNGEIVTKKVINN